MNQGEGKVFVEKVAQEVAHTEVGPTTMDQQQPLQVLELSEGVI